MLTQKQHLNQTGFHAAALIVVLLVVAFTSFVGFRLFHLKSHSTVAGQAVGKSSNQGSAVAQAPTVQVPTGWGIFADHTLGVQFIYPGAYGSFKPQTQFCCNMTQASFPQYDTMLTTDKPTAEYLPGVSGAFAFNTYKKGLMDVSSVKYGPKIKLVANEWIVTEPNPSNPHNYKPGDTYPEISSSNTQGLEVYTTKSIDANATIYTIFFVTNGRLRELQLPQFSSGVSGPGNAFHDQSPYDAMYTQIRDSISLY